MSGVQDGSALSLYPELSPGPLAAPQPPAGHFFATGPCDHFFAVQQNNRQQHGLFLFDCMND
jgi:hypothetical protein